MLEAPKRELLAEVLRRVRVASAVFLRGEFIAPWSFASSDEAKLAGMVAPDAKRLVIMHLAVEGSFRITVDNPEASVLVSQGEGVVLPYCDSHTMGFPDLQDAPPMSRFLPKSHALPMMCRIGDGDGAVTRIACGYLHCDDMLFDPVLRALPRLIHIKPRSEPSGEWRQASLRYVMDELAGGNPNQELVARIPELVLVDCLQQYAETLSPERGGWLASLDDPVIGRALRLIHGAPADDWTVERLAREVGASRSVVAERFTEAIGLPPMRYLAQWRLQLAADLVRTSKLGVAEIAVRVGYESEAAFSRAFKRQFGVSPASWRT